jgi:protein SCO1
MKLGPHSNSRSTTLRLSKIVSLICLALAGVAALGQQVAQKHSAAGIVLAKDPAHRLLTISCEAIPGYMDAMEMQFQVRDPQVLQSLQLGSAVHFNIVEHAKDLFAEDIQISATPNLESEPLQAGRLSALHGAMNPPGTKALAIGDPAPNFILTDQVGKQIQLSQFAGKVVLLTFGYSRCPNPNYCFRLSNNLAGVEKRLHSHAGSDLILMTIAIDPAHDQGAELARYADTWKANPASWHFLTGPLPQIQQVSEAFGMNFWTNEGFVTHSLHTVILDRQGRLAVNLEGNRFTTEELADMVQTVLERP